MPLRSRMLWRPLGRLIAKGTISTYPRHVRTLFGLRQSRLTTARTHPAPADVPLPAFASWDGDRPARVRHAVHRPGGGARAVRHPRDLGRDDRPREAQRRYGLDEPHVAHPGFRAGRLPACSTRASSRVTKASSSPDSTSARSIPTAPPPADRASYPSARARCRTHRPGCAPARTAVCASVRSLRAAARPRARSRSRTPSARGGPAHGPRDLARRPGRAHAEREQHHREQQRHADQHRNRPPDPVTQRAEPADLVAAVHPHVDRATRVEVLGRELLVRPLDRQPHPLRRAITEANGGAQHARVAAAAVAVGHLDQGGALLDHPGASVARGSAAVTRTSTSTSIHPSVS